MKIVPTIFILADKILLHNSQDCPFINGPRSNFCWRLFMTLSSNPAMGTGLSFAAMTHLGMSRGFDLQYRLADKSLQLFLCVGQEDNRVLVTGTTPFSRQPAVLNAIDQFGKWGQTIQLWMVSEKNGTLAARTPPISYRTYVKPFYGKLTISQIASDQPRMTYSGNGTGRLLSKLINNRYYFIYSGKLEIDEYMRGFDCTSFPMVLLGVPRIEQPGYGKQLCDAAGAEICDLEQLKSADLGKRFRENTIPSGLYIIFSAGHVMLYDADKNTLHEFNYGGFKTTPAGQRQLKAPQDLWWARKLKETYRPLFA